MWTYFLKLAPEDRKEREIKMTKCRSFSNDRKIKKYQIDDAKAIFFFNIKGCETYFDAIFLNINYNFFIHF